jgi:transposase-like protein
MKYLFIYFVFSIFFIFQSCGNKLAYENVKLRKEVIAIHDEVMPKMGQLKSCEKVALQMAEEISVSSEPDSLRIQGLKDLALELDQAYEGMFVWMRQYNVEDGDKTPEEVRKYLDEQMEKVTQVNYEIKSVLEKADSLLKTDQ